MFTASLKAPYRFALIPCEELLRWLVLEAALGVELAWVWFADEVE